MLTTFVALMMPVLIVIFAAVLNISHVVDAKIKLQNAADRAAYAGAAMQAHLMDEMGEENRGIHNRFEKFKKDVGPNNNKDEADVKAKLKDARSEIKRRADQIKDWNEDSFGLARNMSEKVARANFAIDRILPRVPEKNMITLLSHYESGQNVDIRSDYNVLASPEIWEPRDHEHVTNNLFSYSVKDDQSFAYWQIELTKKIQAGFMHSIFGTAELHAVSAAQPHGASIRACAFDENCAKYQVSFVPFDGQSQEEHYEH